MSEYCVLVAVKGQLKGSLTRALTYAYNVPTEVTAEQLSTRIESLRETWRSYKLTVRDIYQHQNADGYIDPEDEFETYEGKYMEAQDLFLAARAQRQEPGPSTIAAPGPDALSVLAQQQAQLLDHMSAINRPIYNDLPKINIPSFSGQYVDWPSFKNLFVSSVDQKPGLSNTQRFHYLKTLLTGEAATLIKHVPVTENAYCAAWSRLSERYDRPRHIVNSLLNRFMQLPTAATENAMVLRNVADGANEVIRGLDVMGQSNRDCWVIHLLLNKVDSETRRKWVEESNNGTTPTIDDFLGFLDSRCEQLELVQQPRRINSPRKSTPTVARAMVSTSKPGLKCAVCSDAQHTTGKCTQFISMSATERRQFIRTNALCFNCLRPGHKVTNCNSKFSCRVCQQKHHTLLHLEGDKPRSPSSSSLSFAGQNPNEEDPQSSTTTLSHVSQRGKRPQQHECNSNPSNSILPTALVDIPNAHGHLVTCRVLLDSGSELSFITERCAQLLGLKRSNSRVLVSGISASTADTTRGCCIITMRSKTENFETTARVHILQRITSMLPNSSVSKQDMRLLTAISLADPSFETPSEIDILLGVQHVWDILTRQKKVDIHGKAIATSSHFGWIITRGHSASDRQQASSLVTLIDIDRSLRTFWELEEPDAPPALTPEESAAETHFVETHSRGADGRYVVHLPFKVSDPSFDDTLRGAMCRFTAVERRLHRDDSLREQYTHFMREYIRLGHMRLVPPNEVPTSNGQVFYMPHHPVVGRKLRVVFDGSFKDTMGVSLNSRLHIGPSIQRDLFAVCVRFRMHRYAFSADIVKMFRQIWVTESHRNFQRILWREDPSDPIQHYQLCTVTYGTSCAPFLAVRVLGQIATDYQQSHPIGSHVLQQDFYVDDVLTGAQSEHELILKRDQLVSLLACAGLTLDKWVSNSNVGTLGCTTNESHDLTKLADCNTTKVLGLYWCPTQDTITYRVHLKDSTSACKRQVLSDVARIFDPLGLLAPVVIQLKMLFQELWLKNLSWDDPLPTDLASKWAKYRNNLKQVEELSLPRFAFNNAESIELHGFSDASIKAYGAVVYARARDKDGQVRVSLLAAKTRVAPLKQVSLPRLELCGALLLARLFTALKRCLGHPSIAMYGWCDSTIVLAWLSQPPVKLKTFVGNRTSQILDILPRNVWRHIRSADNPADCASRGMHARDLLNHQLWWNGPDWLSYDIPNDDFSETQAVFSLSDPAASVEVKVPAATALLAGPLEPNPIEELVNRTSSWRKLVRVVAYILRFTSRCRPQRRIAVHSGLGFGELRSAKYLCLRLAQDCFEKDRTSLLTTGCLSKRSPLTKLTPFVDEDGLIRVGGRIRHSFLADHTRHPVILPKRHRVTELILRDEHERNLHPGVTHLLVIIRQNYWILGARNLIRALTFKCIKYFRHRRHITQQQMADLPSVRVRQAFPFENAGCDYAGPITLQLHRGRNPRTSKGYICLFVCLATSAIHLELVTELSTECFLSALRRFMARRGKCSQIYSDNGRNFVGANRAIRELRGLLESQIHNETVASSLAEDGIRWHFIPPHAPHWGGIWESAIRSVKLHLRRVLGDRILTYEQMFTLLTQIEAVVNSRPLGATSDGDVDYLSPAHFLLGQSLSMLPEPDLIRVNPNRWDYWQQVQGLYQGFWKRWHAEYLTSLQSRPKWQKQHPNITVGSLVLVMGINAPPARWPMGRILEVFPGPDGLVRAARIKTQHGIIDRPITKLAIVPVF